MKLLLLAIASATTLPCLGAGNTLPPLPSAAHEYVRHADGTAKGRCQSGENIMLEVALTEGAGLEIERDATGKRLRIFYRMDFNHVTEGWNWHPEAAQTGNDYYTFKYLPLGSSDEVRGTYSDTDVAGQPRNHTVQWRYDYYFSFDNPYDFYARDTEQGNGFSGEIDWPATDASQPVEGRLRMALRGELTENCHAESTTYWHDHQTRPVDFTVKKRYLIGTLREVLFYDVATGNILVRLLPRASIPSAY